MNFSFSFYPTSRAQIYWCRQWIVEGDQGFSKTSFVHWKDIIIQCTMHKSSLKSVLTALYMLKPSFAAAMATLLFNVHHYAKENDKNLVHLFFLFTVLFCANFLQRIVSTAVVLVNDIMLNINKHLNNNAPEQNNAIFGQEPVFIQMENPHRNRTRRLYDKASVCWATLALFSAAWTFRFADERTSAILLLLVYEVVPLLNLSSKKQRLLVEAIVAACFQTLVFAQVNSWLLPTTSPMWFLAIIIHVLVPVVWNVGDGTCHFF